jgi:integrase
MALRFSRLTRPAIRALEPGQRLNEHGITAAKQANGDVRFSVNIMVDGQRIHRVIGRESEGVTREQAERTIEKFRTEAREDRLDLPKGRKKHRTVAEAAEEYLGRMDEGGGKDLVNKRRHLRQWLVPYFRSERLDKLTEFRLRQYRKQRAGEGAKEATINRELATLLHMLRRAASSEWRWIKREDVPQIPRVREQRKQIRIMSPEQSNRLLASALEDQDGDVWLFTMFGLNAAMRHSEIMRRRFDEVDFDNCRIWIDKAKAGERMQPITPALRDAIRQRQEGAADQEGWIFRAIDSRTKKPHRKAMSKQFLRVVERAKLDPRQCTPHIMRHTAISRLLMSGVDIKTAQTISGHKTVAMLLHYAHVLAPHVDEAIGLLDTGFSGTVTRRLHTEPNQADGGEVVSLPKASSKSAA